ncbi:AAA family ATPase [Pseudonocardia spinosispora]|uniref:AAA family ATPase n=1 Tax=Pseudonocardia spinosispora TaxID=103441 RepID=UPI0004229610|nr:MoxR family ATPase [Pseudonocardia spinosispora]
MTDVKRRAEAVLDEIEKVVVGKRPALELILCAVLARAHVLIEDLPGLGKTLIARSFASALGLGFRRVQFTPDLLPADLTGTTVLEQSSGEFKFRQGPVFTNLLLADEINRTPPKTQAALLEAMAEEQVSVDGYSHPLPQPFVVLATDNPIEYEGTYPLPEAQLDRFGLRVRIGYLPKVDEVEMLSRRLSRGSAQQETGQILDAETLISMREAVEAVTVEKDVLDYVVRIVAATREDKDVLVGASPRASLALLQLARARAVLDGRDFVTPDDVKTLAVPTLAHRLSLRPEMWVRRVQAEDVLTRILSKVAAPRTVSTSSDRPASALSSELLADSSPKQRRAEPGW